MGVSWVGPDYGRPKAPDCPHCNPKCPHGYPVTPNPRAPWRDPYYGPRWGSDYAVHCNDRTYTRTFN